MNSLLPATGTELDTFIDHALDEGGFTARSDHFDIGPGTNLGRGSD
jgi:hypothetical protein